MYLYSIIFMSYSTTMTDKKTPGNDFHKLQAEAGERLKELAAINQATQILNEGKSIEETLNRIVEILPTAWQYPEYSASRITFGDLEFTSRNFMPSSWVQRQGFETIDGIKGNSKLLFKSLDFFYRHS